MEFAIFIIAIITTLLVFIDLIDMAVRNSKLKKKLPHYFKNVYCREDTFFKMVNSGPNPCEATDSIHVIHLCKNKCWLFEV